MPLQVVSGGDDTTTTTISDLLGVAPQPPPPPSSAPLFNTAPTVSTTPGVGQGIAVDLGSKLPVSIPAQSIPLTSVDPTTPLIGQIWYRQDTSQLSIRHDGNTTKRNTFEAGASASYTPTWTGSTSNPSLGNGTLTGSYCQVGKLVIAEFKLVAGSTTTFGSGSYTFSLPVAGASSFAGDVYGGGIMLLSGGGSATLLRWRPDGLLVLNQSALSFVSAASLAFASGSEIHGNVTYIAT